MRMRMSAKIRTRPARAHKMEKASKHSFLLLILALVAVAANPASKPYIAFRTDPLDQPVDHPVDWDSEQLQEGVQSTITKYDAVSSQTCPVAFNLGISKRAHTIANPAARAIRASVSVHPIYPDLGPGRQVIYTTQYEHLDVLTPAPLTTPGEAIREALVQSTDHGFPLLLEGSSLFGTPVIHDFNHDGIADAAVVDYDGGLTIMGLATSAVEGGGGTGRHQERYLHHAQLPRLNIRREWLTRRVGEELPATEAPTQSPSKASDVDATENSNTATTIDSRKPANAMDDPYHSYFGYAWSDSKREQVLRGVPANVLEQDRDQIKALQERRQRRILPDGLLDTNVTVGGGEEIGNEGLLDPLSGVQLEEGEPLSVHRRLDEYLADADDLGITAMLDDDGVLNRHDDEKEQEGNPEYKGEMGRAAFRGDDGYPGGDDYAADDPDYGRDMYDDYMGYNADYEEYYDAKHYLRVPPHVLSDPILAELPKLYNSGNAFEVDTVLFMAVSYYLDEDEYQGYFTHTRYAEKDTGDETETRRGAYVASALVAYIVGDSSRWSTQQHLDLSTDFTAPENVTIVGALPVRSDTSRLGAFALASPTIADLSGDGSLKVLIPTSMGMIYCFDARQSFKRDKWPIQLKYPIESRILVEDVVGNTNLEIFVADTGGNILCFDHEANRLWNRNVMNSLSMGSVDLTASSPMTLGDINGDGVLDLVAVFQIGKRVFVFGLNAATGEDLAHFPIELEGMDRIDPDEELHQKLPQPLLVDLHGDQRHVQDYIRRNGTKWTAPTLANWHGGSAAGLHIVQPMDERLCIIEAGSGCVQAIDMGDSLEAMVQVDDVHGNGKLDLVIATGSGNIVTLETSSPYHPLNVWNHGATRNRMGGFAHGYSASQGIFVHEQSRQYIDVFGVYVQVTFEIFDNRPGIAQEPDKRKYTVQIRDGTSSKRILFQQAYHETGVRTERVYIRYGPGYYSLTVMMLTSHGLVYEDAFHVGYNVNFMDGFGLLLLLPLLLASVAILLCGSKKANWDEDDFDADRDIDGGNLGILGRALPT